MAPHEAGLDLDARAGIFSFAKRTWPPGQRQPLSPGDTLQDACSVKISTAYCNRMVADAADRGDVQEAITRMQKLRSDGLHPDGVAFNSLVMALVRTGDLDAVEEWITALSTPALYPEFAGLKLNATVYNDLVTTFAEQRKLAKAEKHASDMHDRGLKLDRKSYESLLQTCLAAGHTRRAHHWCQEMAEAGFRKPNKTMMKNLVCALTDAGNTQSANHWLTFMAEIGQPLDAETYEHVRTAYPLEIVPTLLSGEAGKCVPPVIRPAAIGGERRIHEVSATWAAATPRGLSSPGRPPGSPLLLLVGSSGLKSPSKAGRGPLQDMGMGDAWLARKRLGPGAARLR